MRFCQRNLYAAQVEVARLTLEETTSCLAWEMAHGARPGLIRPLKNRALHLLGQVGDAPAARRTDNTLVFDATAALCLREALGVVRSYVRSGEPGKTWAVDALNDINGLLNRARLGSGGKE